MPPQMSNTILPTDVPMGTSTSPMLLILPVTAKTLVPFDDSVPILAKTSPPSIMIWGMLAKVSTLLRMVGFFHRPCTAGKGGRGLGMPRRPSMEAISAVSSPHTNAPAPW